MCSHRVSEDERGKRAIEIKYAFGSFSAFELVGDKPS